MAVEITYPFVPPGKVFHYVSLENPYMALAREYAKKYSLDVAMPGGAIVVKGDLILSAGTNGSDYHKLQGCQRVALGCRSGEGYELCEGCHPRNHSEAKAVAGSLAVGANTRGSDLYLWGHWWCCQACWKVMEEAGIGRVFLLAGSEIIFNKEHPGNMVGRQFAED